MPAVTVIRRFAKLHDVDFAGAQNGDAAIFDSATGKMKPGTVAGSPGPPGPTGPTGPTGATGSQGPTGATGSQGPQGNPGTAGATGSQGPAGVGVPAGGAVGTVLTKSGPADYETIWQAVTGGGGSGLPADTVVPSGTRIISNKLLVADAQPNWRLDGSGKIEWGLGGGSGLAASLQYTWQPTLPGYRLQMSEVAVMGDIISSGGGIFRTTFGGSAANEIRVGQKDGSNVAAGFWFGQDSNLYRSAAGWLATDGSFVAKQAVYVDNQGAGYGLTFGAAGDASLARFGANQLYTPGDLIAYKAVYVDYNNAGGKLYFGGAADANLYRLSAGVLRADGDLQVGGKVTGNGTVPAGGTTDQVLAKSSATDYALKWATPAGGGGGMNLDYFGDYVAGTYNDGDIVVYNGIAYMCVVDGTTTPPEVWPKVTDPAPPIVWTLAPFSNTGIALFTFVSQVIPGGTLGSTKKLRVKLNGTHVLTGAGTNSTFRLVVSYGGVPFYDVTSGTFLTNGNRALSLDLDLAAISGATNLFLNGKVVIGPGGAPTVGYGAMAAGQADTISAVFSSAGALVVDSTIAQTLLVQMAFSQNTTTTTLQHGTIEVVG